MKQAILVLGANGFIGTAVIAGLASTNWATPLLGVRRPAANRNAGIEQRIVDATNLDSLLAAMQGVAGIVNCVAGDSQTIVGGAKALFEAAARLNPAPRIVHLSTMSVYGSAVGLVDETAQLRGDLGPYSAAKVAAEEIASAYPHTVILRPGCVFGPGSEQWSIRIARRLLSHRLGDLGAAGDGDCNLSPIADIVMAILRALQEPSLERRIYNLSIPEPPTWNEFLVKFATALRAVPVRRISRRRLRIETKLLAPPLKVAEIIARAAKLNPRIVPYPIPPSLVRLMGQEIRLDTKRAEAELELRAKDLEQTLEETAHWYLKSEFAA